MSYIGRGLQAGAFRQLDDISSGFDGSDATHTMQVNSVDVTVGDVNQILLSLGGVIQKPGTDFTVASSVITFTTAPAANTSFFAILLGSDNGGTVTPTDLSVSTGKIAADAITSAKIADDAVTGDHIASSGAFAIGAAGTASTLAGIPFYSAATSSIYTHDVSGTDNAANYNTAYGVTAMDAITTGDQNTAIGFQAGSAMNSGTNNVLIGYNAGGAITTGQSNIAIGTNALDAEDTGNKNIAIGVAALGAFNFDSDGFNNAIGYEAGKSLTSGRYNLLIGNNAGDLFDTEDDNQFIGYQSGSSAINGGEFNTAIGNYTLDALTSGDYNLALGHGAGGAITSGGANVCLGAFTGDAITTGSQNTILGIASDPAANNNENSIVIGYNLTGKGSNTGFISPNGGAMYQGNNGTAWTQTSDERVKKNIKDYDKGLNEINKLKIRTFDYRRLSEMPLGKNDIPLENNEMPENNQVGLIAQETIDIFPNTIIENSDNGRLSLQSDEINWALIKAVQELSATVTTLQQEINTLKGK